MPVEGVGRKEKLKRGLRVEAENELRAEVRAQGRMPQQMLDNS